MKKTAIAGLCLAGACTAWALAPVRGVVDTDHGVRVKTEKGTLQLVPYSASVIRVVFID